MALNNYIDIGKNLRTFGLSVPLLFGLADVVYSQEPRLPYEKKINLKERLAELGRIARKGTPCLPNYVDEEHIENNWELLDRSGKAGRYLHTDLGAIFEINELTGEVLSVDLPDRGINSPLVDSYMHQNELDNWDLVGQPSKSTVHYRSEEGILIELDLKTRRVIWADYHEAKKRRGERKEDPIPDDLIGLEGVVGWALMNRKDYGSIDPSKLEQWERCNNWDTKTGKRTHYKRTDTGQLIIVDSENRVLYSEIDLENRFKLEKEGISGTKEFPIGSTVSREELEKSWRLTSYGVGNQASWETYVNDIDGTLIRIYKDTGEVIYSYKDPEKFNRVIIDGFIPQKELRENWTPLPDTYEHLYENKDGIIINISWDDRVTQIYDGRDGRFEDSRLVAEFGSDPEWKKTGLRLTEDGLRISYQNSRNGVSVILDPHEDEIVYSDEPTEINKPILGAFLDKTTLENDWKLKDGSVQFFGGGVHGDFTNRETGQQIYISNGRVTWVAPCPFGD